MKAIILARVSTTEQIQEGQSVPAQLARAREYATRNGLKVVREFSIDESSLKDHRGKFEKVIEEIRNSKEKIALVAETIDRVQRSFKESVLLLEMVKNEKVDVHFIRENLIIHKDSNSSEYLRWDMGVMLARSFVLNIGDNVKRTFELKKRNGEWTSKAPIGYQNIALDKARRLRKDIIPDPDRRHLIVKLFEIYSSGNCSIKTLRDKITKEGLKSSAGKTLSVSMVDHILNNPFYYGEMRSKGTLYQHKYEPLISRELFNKCITKDEYDKKLKELKEIQYDINIQIEDHTRADESYHITASTVLNLAKNAKELFERAEVKEKRAMLNYMLQDCVFDGKKLQFGLRSPYNYILNLGVSELKQKTAETLVSSGLLQNTSLGFSEVKNDNIRTSRKPSVKPRHGRNSSTSRPLLRR